MKAKQYVKELLASTRVVYIVSYPTAFLQGEKRERRGKYG